MPCFPGMIVKGYQTLNGRTVAVSRIFFERSRTRELTGAQLLTASVYDRADQSKNSCNVSLLRPAAEENGVARRMVDG